MLKVKQVAIIGTGLLGTSIGLALKRAGYAGEIVGIGRRMATLEAAEARGAVDRVSTHYASGFGNEALVIIAVPLGGFEAVFDLIVESDRRDLVITDVGSTKSLAVNLAARKLRSWHQFVGSHPMAGSEQQGPEGARADLFDQRPCIVTPTDASSASAIATVESLWTTLGMSLLHMTAEEHDRQTAVISHVPHLASVLLVEVAAALGGWEIASTGFRDTTRLASSNPPMRADIVTANRAQVVATLDTLRDRLDSLRETIVRDDRDALLERLERARQIRDQWAATQPSTSSPPASNPS